MLSVLNKCVFNDINPYYRIKLKIYVKLFFFSKSQLVIEIVSDIGNSLYMLDNTLYMLDNNLWMLYMLVDTL